MQTHEDSTHPTGPAIPLADVDRFVMPLDQTLPSVWSSDGHDEHRVTVEWDGNGHLTFHVVDPLDQIDLGEAGAATFTQQPTGVPGGFHPGQYGTGEIAADVTQTMPVDPAEYAAHVADGAAPQDALLTIAADHLNDVRDALHRHVDDGIRARGRAALRAAVAAITAGKLTPDDFPAGGDPDHVFEVTLDRNSAGTGNAGGVLAFDLPTDLVTMTDAGCSADDIALVRTWAAGD